MNFNDLTVKLTSNANYQSLQSNKQEQIKALIKGYESYAQNITQSFYDNIAKMQKETQDKIKNAKTWGTILNFASLGTYPVTKGIVNGLTDFVTGGINIGIQLVNNIGQVIVPEGRFGGGIDGYFKELGSDLLYTVTDPLISVAEGLTKGVFSVANIFGLDDKEFNRFLDLTTNWGLYERDRILTFGGKEDDSFSRIAWFFNDTSSPDKDKLIKEHTWDWARNTSIATAQGGTWFKDNVSPVIGKMISPLGIAIDSLGQHGAGEFFSETMESIGRMIPAIVATYYGNSTALASAISQIYFFSSSFGNGFSEAIAKGATLEEAYTYGYGTASVETLTEQIGGVQLGKLLPGGVATKVATSKLGKVLQHPVMRVIKAGIDEGMEEVMSEAMSAGLESIISDDPVSNQDFMSRAMSAFLGGAISGGIFGSAGYYAHQNSTVGKNNSLNKEIKRIYEGQNKDYGKAQQVFNQKVDSLLNSYNRDSVVDNNLIEEGKRTPESRIQAKKDLLENSGFASILIEYNEKNQNFQLTKKGIEMTTDLKGYMGDSNKNAYSSTLYGLEDTLATKVTNQELNSEQQDVMKLSKKLGSDVVFYTDSDTSINGFFNDGIVYLNTESKKSYLTNFIHELTHSLEGTKQYDTLKNFLMEISETNEILKAKMEELGLTKESIVKDYWNQISNLKNIESKAYLMASEYVAFAMSEVILKDKASIESLTKNKTIGRKILNWIKEKIADIKTPKTDIEKAFLKDLKHAKDLYEEALGVGYRKGLKIGEVDKRFSITKDSQDNELSKEQQEFFKDSKVVDEEGNLLVVYHGTTWDFNIFDKVKANVENDFGQGFYFTNSDYDAENNYSGEEGIDLSNRIKRLAEQIEIIDEVDEKVALERARTILLGSENKILEVFLNITNPATNDTILIDREPFYENYNEEDFESYEEYEEQVESEFQDFLEETIYDIERILDFELDNYSNKNLKKLIYELSYENFSLYDVKEYINRNYEFNDGEGNLATNEIVRALVESLGYDGIIDDRVSMKFKGMGLGRDVVHYIVFNSNQIKNTNNLKPTNNPDIRFSRNVENGIDFNIENNSDSPYFNFQDYRGELTKEKIIYRLKNTSFHNNSDFGFVRELKKFDSIEDLYKHIFYHGSSKSFHFHGGKGKSIVPSVALPVSANIENMGGGYGERYFGISLSRSKNVAKNFSGQNSYVNVYTVLLKKDAKVVSMPQIEDAVDLEDYIVDLWKNKVDAVLTKGFYETDFSEQEIIIINPRAIQLGDFQQFQVYKIPHLDNMTLSEVETKVKKSLNENIRFSKTTDSEGRKLTVEQEKYFKDSKVRDAKGGLQVVYHGTNSKFDEFLFSKIDKSNPKLKGFWFINNKQNAYQYGNNIKEGYVNITKPLSLEDKHINKEQYTNFLEYVFNNDGENKTLIQQKDFKENISELYDSIENDYELINYIQSMYNEDSKISRFNEILKEKTGYDGTIFEDGGNTIAISLSPNQFKAVDNLTPTSVGDIRYSRNVENGIDNNVEMEILDNVIKDTYKNYNKKTYLDTITKRQQSLNEINLKEIAKTTNGKKRVKVIETLMKEYEQIIKKNYNRSELYNHVFNNVIQEIILELSNNFGDTTFADKAKVVDVIISSVSQSMAYLDNTFNNNQYNLLDKENPNGYQYTKLINWGFRELLNATTPNERNAVLQSRKLSPLWDMIENIVKLDITNNQSILEFNAGIKNFFNRTRVEQRNVFGLNGDKSIHTIPVVLKQNDTHIENLTKLVGTMELQSKDGKKTTYKRTNGLLGDVRLFDKLSGTRLDMFAFGNIFGLFMEESTGSVMTNRIFEAQYQQLEVSNKFYEYFEKDGFLKNNRKNIDLLEQEVSSLTNLLDGNGNPIIIPNSQVVYLRDIMLREIVRDRMIENGYRGGEQSNYFKDDGFVFINGNSNNRKTNEANRVQAKITNILDLFNELDSIVKENKFMTEYNQKLLGFFELMYEFENARNKDISGLELTNDKDTIANLTDEQRAILTSGLNEVNIDSIYVPMRSVGSNKSSGAGAFDINTVIDLGIDDGMVMGITESKNPPLIDSINNIIPQYTRSVANFYGLFRVVNDLNILFNKEISLSDGSRITLADKVSKISPYIVPYYEKLLRDMSGYGVNSDITSEGFNRFMGKIRRNFFKASLGLNAKVILTQFASMFTISTMYGDFKGTKKSLMLSVMKNVFAKGSKTKAKYLIENSEIYKDRARNSTYEISEATSSAFNKSKFNEVTEFLMKGITVTDNMINRAFFISLVEHGYTEAQALKMTEEAISRYQSSGLSINKNELLRTQNELVRVFTKFLGEPMKVVSNMEESIKHIQIINRLENNQEAINESFDNDLAESKKQLETLKQEKVAIENLIDNEKDKAKKKALEKTLKVTDKNILAQKENVLEQEKNTAQIKKQVQGVIDGKANARKELGKRVTAFMLSITWQTLLGVAFSALRTGGKDKDEDEEVWGYLGKKFGWQLANEAMGYLPFVRDIYSLIVNKYDANVVSDFQAFNDLGSSISGILTDMTNGGDFNYGKHIRKVSIHLGQILGIPTRQIERLFTTPSNYFMKSANYSYRDMTGQYITNKELTNAIKNGDDKLIETILNRRLNSKGVSLTNSVSKEINRLAKNGAVVNPSGIPNSFSIDGVEYKNDKDKFAETYNNATFVVEKIITLNGYKRLDDEYKAKLIKAIFTYYHSLAKQNVSGVQIFTKERTYNLNQAYRYFRDRISYYMNQQQKEKKKKRA